MNNAELDARLRAANPVPVAPIPGLDGRSLLMGIAQIAAAILVALSVGVGVAWAASGSNPLAPIFADTLKVGESKTGFENFEALSPMTEESLETLPRNVVDLALFQASHETLVKDRQSRAPSTLEDLKPDPTLISAFARAKTNLGTPSILLVIDDEVCAFVLRKDQSSNSCYTVEDVESGNHLTWHTEPMNTQHKYLTGVFNDRVETIDVLGDGRAPILIPDNVFELRDVDQKSTTLVGRDADGSELFRQTVAIEHP